MIGWARFLLLIQATCVKASFSGCAGFVSIPKDALNSFSTDELKVQLYLEGSAKPAADAEVAPKSGFFHISHDRHGPIQIRLLHPEGWTFDKTSVSIIVDGETDICSVNQDIIFNFEGIKYSGQIKSSGGHEGPSGITVSLETESGQATETITQEGGIFYFSNAVKPQAATLSASHSRFSISKAIQIALGPENILAYAPVVTGYQVTGRVEENGLPMAGVSVDLVTQTGDLSDSVITGEDGNFIFNEVPAGTFVVKAFFEKDGAVFSIEPASQNIAVSNNDNKLESAFRITGLTASGLVQTKSGSGLPDVEIFIDGIKSGKTDDKGEFMLVNVKPGVHEILAQKEDYDFVAVNVDINSNNPNIQAISPYRVRLCADTNIDDTKLMLLSETGKVLEQSSGCFMVTPDVYTLRPADSSFHFSPKQIQVTVTDQPSKSHSFKRFTRRFSAFVRCLGTCQSFSANIVDANGERVPLILGKTEDNRREIEHSSLDPGEYTIEVSSENWCFEQSSNKKIVKTTVAPEGHPDPVPLEIVQKAYRLQLKSEVITEVEIIAGGRKVVEKLKPGFNNLCITAGGEYTISPRGCHNFAKSSIQYNTASPSVISLSPVSHKVTVEIEIAENKVDAAELKLTVNGEEVNGGQFESGKLRYSLDVRSEKVTIEPRSPTMFIHPKRYSGFASFDASSGCASPIVFGALDALFIKGKFEPAVSGVEVRLESSDATVEEKIITANNGQYAFGPLNPHLKYTVNPTHQTYRFLPKADDLYSFQALQLANLVINLDDNDGNQMSDVTIKLSGPERYRKIAKINAQESFNRLEPGDYYIIFEKKEFQFQPNKFEITLTEDKQLNIVGKRVQFSAYGRLVSPSQAAFADYLVEAVSESCADHYEESKTDVNGQFRIMGLNPGCNYDLKIKSPGSYVVSPENIKIDVIDSDKRNIEFQAFKSISQTRLSGNVLICPTCPLKGLKVELFSLDEDKNRSKHALQILYLNEDSGTFFNFASLEFAENPVEVVLTGPDDSSSQIIYLNAPLKHVSFRYNHQKASDKTIQAHGQNKLGPALVLLAMILSTILLNREKLAELVESSTKPTPRSSKKSSKVSKNTAQRM
ncbi:unnamed protein product [Oikopleura dioica]|uniref:Uncharacterized protein n=1 Tax=Oikopleura dioica TaxID=34765 RepID=E4X855_OIKDI|nr:unnamed protein product [Oikopleura dioica]